MISNNNLTLNQIDELLVAIERLQREIDRIVDERNPHENLFKPLHTDNVRVNGTRW